MNRPLIFARLIESLQQTLETAKQAAENAHDLATHEQSKAETQYDTVGLEASYLAEGQSKRVLELNVAIKDWQTLQHLSFNNRSEIKAGALVTLVSQDDKEHHYLLGHYAGGTKITLAKRVQDADPSAANTDDKLTIITVSVASPIGQSLLHKSVDDEFTLNLDVPLSYEITAIS